MKKTNLTSAPAASTKKGNTKGKKAPAALVADVLTMDDELASDADLYGTTSLLDSPEFSLIPDAAPADVVSASDAVELGLTAPETVTADELPALTENDVPALLAAAEENGDAVPVDAAAALTDAPAAPVVVEVPNFCDTTDAGLAATVAYFTDKVKKGLAICKSANDGKGGLFSVSVDEKVQPTVTVKYYADKVRNGKVGHWSVVFIKSYGKRGGANTQDYWVDVIKQYVSVN